MRVPALLGSRIPLASLVQTLAVAEHLNFRHAANALGVSQSSVSARIAALEETLGIILFERHARGVHLTEAGRHFVERVAAGVDQLDLAVQTAGMVARSEHGRLRVGIDALIHGDFLSILIESYREQHPGVDIEFIEGGARENVMRIRANKLDLTFLTGAVLTGAAIVPDCHARTLWSERLLAALPMRHRLTDGTGVTWTDLANDTFIVRQGGIGPHVQNHIVMRLAGTAAGPSIRRFDVGRDTLLTMVTLGYGVTIVGEATTLLQAPGLTLLPILDEPEPLSCSAIWSPHNSSPALRGLLDLAGEMIR